VSGINIDDLREGHDRIFHTMQWAQEDIEAAQCRHPGVADWIWRSFLLLRPYARMWRLAQLPPGELADASGHYEALEGSLIDEHEAWLRPKLRQDWRLPPGACTPPTAHSRPS
jgi:hypothetical protein